MTPRTLNVWINDALVGYIREHNGLWAFGYAPAWLASNSAFPVCPGLPLQPEEHLDGASYRPVQWYFDNLLPEEGQRALLAKASAANVEDAFALLQVYGAESAGSLTLLPPDTRPSNGTEKPLPYEELSQRIQHMPQVPLAYRSAKKMSLAGAQHKMAVIYRDGSLFDPEGSTPSTHILKPDHPDRAWAHSVINEWFVMTLAKRVGLAVPEVTRLYVPEPVYLVARFDRSHDAGHWQRQHCLDTCQLLGLSREFKYSAGSVSRLAGVAALCAPAAVARLALFEWLVFNVLVGNEDAHLKNLSFLTYGSKVRLAPFYDLLCMSVYGTRAFERDAWPQAATLAWPIEGEARLNQVTPALLLTAAEVMGIKPGTARKAISRLVTHVSTQAKQLLAEVGQENSLLAAQRPALKATLAGEMRLLRAIVSIVIAEMTRQLGPIDAR